MGSEATFQKNCQKCLRPISLGEQLTQWNSVCRCDRPYSPSTRFSLDVCANCKRRVPTLVGESVQCGGICTCSSPAGKKIPTQIKPTESDAVTFDFASLGMSAANFPVERYAPIALLGDGARAAVILARDKQRGTKVAVKCFKRLPPTLQAGFQNEAKKIQQLLSHPNIVKILDFGFTSAKTPYMVTDYKDGFDLEQYLALYGTPSTDVAISILSSVCDTLAYAQKQGVLHRNIKPGNIIFYDDMNSAPTVLITDFALANYSAGDDLIDARDALYMSADQARNIDYTERSEVYSVGCIGYALLAGRPLFQQGTALDIKNLHALTLAPRICDVKFDNKRPRQLEEVVEKCLEKDPSYRFDSVAQLGTRLALFSQQEQAALRQASDAKRIKTLLVVGGFSIAVIVILLLLFSPALNRAPDIQPGSSSTDTAQPH